MLVGFEGTTSSRVVRLLTPHLVILIHAVFFASSSPPSLEPKKSRQMQHEVDSEAPSDKACNESKADNAVTPASGPSFPAAWR